MKIVKFDDFIKNKELRDKFVKKILNISEKKIFFLLKEERLYNIMFSEFSKNISCAIDLLKKYAKQIRKNAKVLESEFNTLGYKLMFGGTDNHLLLIDAVTSKGISGAEAEKALDIAGITVNKNMIPDDARSAMDPSGIRLGTPALTTRGFKEEEMKLVAEFIDRALTNSKNEAVLSEIKAEVKKLNEKFPLYPELHNQ